jgi:hypothetical protein
VFVSLLMAMNAAVFLGASLVLLLILRHNRQ